MNRYFKTVKTSVNRRQ